MDFAPFSKACTNVSITFAFSFDVQNYYYMMMFIKWVRLSRKTDDQICISLSNQYLKVKCVVFFHILVSIQSRVPTPSKLKVTTAKHSIKAISIWQLLACVPFVTLGILYKSPAIVMSICTSIAAYCSISANSLSLSLYSKIMDTQLSLVSTFVFCF